MNYFHSFDNNCPYVPAYGNSKTFPKIEKHTEINFPNDECSHNIFSVSTPHYLMAFTRASGTITRVEKMRDGKPGIGNKIVGHNNIL